MFDIEDFKLACDCIKEQRPLIVNITNYVAMTPSANALLAIGASPIMVAEPSEVEDIVEKCSALVINIGSLENGQIEAMKLAAACAHSLEIPWVLDPAGVGMSWLRTATAMELIKQYKPSVIRANASEVAALASALIDTQEIDQPLPFSPSGGIDFEKAMQSHLSGMAFAAADTWNNNVSDAIGDIFDESPSRASSYDINETHRSRRYQEPKQKFPVDESNEVEITFASHGLDSAIDSKSALEYAQQLAEFTGAIVSLSGEIDYITDAQTTVALSNGNPLMSKVTAMGCIASAVTAAFLSVACYSEEGKDTDYLQAAVNAMALMGVCGEYAYDYASGNSQQPVGTGTFFVKFLDALSTFDAQAVAQKVKILE